MLYYVSKEWVVSIIQLYVVDEKFALPIWVRRDTAGIVVKL